MANIAITSHCNLNCRYCFTQEEYTTGTDSAGHMPLAIYEQALDFVLRSDVKQIRILGGEPTLHPDFISYLELALKTGRPVRLFSNGFMPENVLEFLNNVPEEKIRIVLNITHQTEAPFRLSPKLERTLHRLNQKIMPGINISKKGIQLDFLLDFIRMYNLKTMVRLGLAHPCIGFKNQYLLPKHYVHIGQKIIHFASKAQQQSVKIHLDCGFVPCMFGNGVLKQFGLDTDLGLHCEPIPDILPDGSIVSCYPLSGISRLHLIPSSTSDSMREQFLRKIPEYEIMGVFRTCSMCEYKKRGFCTGGCTAHKILRFNEQCITRQC